MSFSLDSLSSDSVRGVSPCSEESVKCMTQSVLVTDDSLVSLVLLYYLPCFVPMVLLQAFLTLMKKKNYAKLLSVFDTMTEIVMQRK